MDKLIKKYPNLKGVAPEIEDLVKQYPSLKEVLDKTDGMRTLMVDNGIDFHSKSLEIVCSKLGIAIHCSPSYNPYQKGKIERSFAAHTVRSRTRP